MYVKVTQSSHVYVLCFCIKVNMHNCKHINKLAFQLPFVLMYFTKAYLLFSMSLVNVCGNNKLILIVILILKIISDILHLGKYFALRSIMNVLTLASLFEARHQNCCKHSGNLWYEIETRIGQNQKLKTLKDLHRETSLMNLVVVNGVPDVWLYSILLYSIHASSLTRHLKNLGGQKTSLQ